MLVFYFIKKIVFFAYEWRRDWTPDGQGIRSCSSGENVDGRRVVLRCFFWLCFVTFGALCTILQPVASSFALRRLQHQQSPLCCQGISWWSGGGAGGGGTSKTPMQKQSRSWRRDLFQSVVVCRSWWNVAEKSKRNAKFDPFCTYFLTYIISKHICFLTGYFCFQI